MDISSNVLLFANCMAYPCVYPTVRSADPDKNLLASHKNSFFEKSLVVLMVATKACGYKCTVRVLLEFFA
jgi:hypothetical protein